jgi:serine/threonine protein kinase
MPSIDHIPRTVTGDEDGGDHIGYETPRSGVATPQPDLQDKRLPGIMSYFGQVRQDPLAAQASFIIRHQDGPSPSHDMAEEQLPTATSVGLPLQYPHEGTLPDSDSMTESLACCHIDEAGHGNRRGAAKSDRAASHPFPTPPISQPTSSGSSFKAERPVSGHRGAAAPSAEAPTGSIPSESSTYPQPSTEVSRREGKTSSFLKCEAQRPISPLRAHSSPSPSSSAPKPENQPTSVGVPAPRASSSKWFSLNGLMGLTRGVFKSGPPTPTRALSTAQSSHSEPRESNLRTSDDGAETSGTQTPRVPPGAQAPTPKGKLTIKIPEARGLRKCKDPYVVVVFQRSELISGGPRFSDDGETLAIPPPLMGGIPIQRQGSDSGRPPMSIPMRSRQSSNTSNADHGSFRSRSARSSFTNPKWDAEAVFDVVDTDMLVDISVYDHTASGEEFLGHVDFHMEREADHPMEGWFQLRGHADTNVENIPTGEIFVEALYYRSEKKHFGPSDFEILKLIGKGTFGQVYQVRKKDTKRIYAMKVLQKKVIVQKKEVAHTVGERNILVRTAMSDSPFIVGLKFSFQTPSDLYLVTDYMSGGELFWHLQKEGRFDEKRAKFYIAELILAIQHLHNSDIVYRDLKPENILLDANGHIALCDFGLSKANLTNNDTTNTFCGTTEYLAPEVLLDESGYTKMVDFWSLGVLVFEMCCGWSPFYAEDTQQMYKNIAFGKVRFPRDTLSQEGRNFVKGLLNRNPKHRLGATDDAEELKRHAFFNDIDWDLLSKKLITPPFKPKLKSETDVSYFDPEFTTALDQNGSLNERAAAMARGYAASTPLSPSVQANFQGFTFVDESALDDHMGSRSRMDDEDMDDARGTDDDWDNLDDVDPRRANQMSGIVRSGHDEQMVGGAHFDV